MNYLERIMEFKREEVRVKKQRFNPSSFRDMEYFTRPPLSLRESLRKHPVFGIIAEVKRSSPSAGTINAEVDPGNVAAEYEAAGAAGISVLTDKQFFSGSLDDLVAARRLTQLPLLRKDFIFDEFQVMEAKGAGADAILLIASVLDRIRLSELVANASELGLECLAELYEAHEIDILDFDQVTLVGINNRDLRTFEVDLGHSITLARQLPPTATIVSESGIKSAADLRRLHKGGVHAALIGEHFMRSGKPGLSLKKLLDNFRTATAGEDLRHNES